MNTTATTSPILETGKLTVGYSKSHGQKLVLIRDADLTISKGEIVCLLGPNGSGKSTLLRTLSGLQPALDGWVKIMGSLVKNNQPQVTAQMLSVVLTEPLAIRDLTVRQLVAMGRYPYVNWMGKLKASDHHLIEQSLAQARLEGFEDRSLFELSDGELQRVMIAKALCQDTPVIFLDEPTAHLDLPNRVAIMRLLRTLAKHTGKSILFSSHELDLALQTSDTLWLLRPGKPVWTGIPEDMILNGAFEATFNAEGVDFDKTTGNFRFHHHSGFPVFCSGNTIVGFWTHRALEREGFEISEDPGNNVHLKIFNNPRKWILAVQGLSFEFEDLGSVIVKLNSIRSGQPTIFKKS